MACGSRVASALDTRSIVRLGSSGKSGCMAAVRPGLVDEHDERRHRRRLLGGRHERARAGADRRAGHREGARGGDAEVEQRDAERDRAGELELDRRAPTGHRAEERAQADERLAVDARGGERRARVEHRVVELERSVGEHVDAVDAPRGLGDHPLHAGAVRQRRRGGQARLALEHEGRGRARVGVRQAPDGARHPVLKVDDLHRRCSLPSHCFPLVGQPREWPAAVARGQISASHGLPRRTLAGPHHVGPAAPAASVPRSVTRSASTAWRWRARRRGWRG